jgi:hypothetical protein
VINSDDGVISGTSGLKSSGGDDGNLVFQSKGTETARINTDKQIVAAAGTASLPALTTTGDLNTGIFFPAADTIAFGEGGAEAMRIDSSGRVGVATTTPDSGYTMTIEGIGSQGSTSQLVLKRRGDDQGVQISAGGGGFNFTPYDGTDNVYPEYNFNQKKGSTSREVGRFTQQGYFKASNTGSYREPTGSNHEFRNTADNVTLFVTTTDASTSTAGVLFVEAGRNTTNNTFYAISYFNQGAGAYKFRVADSGNVTNTNNSYGSISDVKLKQDIVDAGSQWDDIKNLRVRKYRWKSEPDGFMQMGLVAQEAELVSPGLIEEHSDYEEVEVPVLDDDGNPVLDEAGNPQVTKERNDLGTTTKSVKYSILYMKAVKALQEAMERIETLEAKVAALEAVPGNE